MEIKGNTFKLASEGELAQPRIDPEGLLPEISRLTLGRRLVRLDITAAIDEQRCEDTEAAAESAGVKPPLKAYDLMQRIQSRRDNEADLQIIRKKIAGLETRHAARFNWYCMSSAAPFIKMVKDGSDDPKKTKALTWVEWLGREADDAQLLNFLQWHNHELDKLNKAPEVVEKVELQRQQYKQAVTLGVSEGWLHPSATTAVDAVDDIKIYVGDMFETHFQGADGYHRYGFQEVVVATVSKIPGGEEDFESIVRPLKWTVKHELNHAILGRFEPRWLNEALTEHIAQVMDYGEPDDIDPDSRTYNKYGGSYQYERSLLRTVLAEGKENIPVRMAMLAYSDKSTDKETAKAFTDAVDRSWAHLVPEGQSALENLNYYIDALEEQLMEDQGVGRISAGRMAAILVQRIFRQHPDGEKLREVFAGEDYWRGKKIKP